MDANRTMRRAAWPVIVVMVVTACGTSASPSPSVSTSAPTPIATASPATPTPSVSARPSASPSDTPRPTRAADIAVESLIGGLTAPVGIVTPPDGTGRLFVLDQTGTISILDGRALQTPPFLDLTSRLVKLDTDYDERGLLGLAFHPDFAHNGRFFVYYSAPLRAGAAAGQDHTDTLSEFRIDPADPSHADATSERQLLQFEQPQPNHSGGALGFGPDGFLYLGVGDGGGSGDASEGHSKQGNAQDTKKLNGKVLRIDVDHGDRYAVPADNPFAQKGGRPEIYAYGFRNPWRLSWEPSGQRRLLVSDVGYGRFEEVDVVVRGGNYGWRIREGTHCLDVAHPLEDPPSCATKGANGDPLIAPVVEYAHADIGVAVVGGYRYRGTALPALAGQYIFADLSGDPNDDLSQPLGSLLVATPSEDAGVAWAWRSLVVEKGQLRRFVTGMGEGPDGELYVLTRQTLGPSGTTGEVLKLVPPSG